MKSLLSTDLQQRRHTTKEMSYNKGDVLQQRRCLTTKEMAYNKGVSLL
jgi:hypothetical protein